MRRARVVFQGRRDSSLFMFLALLGQATKAKFRPGIQQGGRAFHYWRCVVIRKVVKFGAAVSPMPLVALSAEEPTR